MVDRCRLVEQQCHDRSRPGSMFEGMSSGVPCAASFQVLLARVTGGRRLTLCEPWQFEEIWREISSVILKLGGLMNSKE